MKEEKKYRLHPRRFARKMAKAALDAEGVTGYNKQRVGPDGTLMPSTFARNWRTVAATVHITLTKKKKGARK